MSNIYTSTFIRASALLSRSGVFTAVLKPLRMVFARWIIQRLPPRPFTFRGRAYLAFYDRYNTTWINERCVEIPIVREFIRDYPPHEVLEVGNVLAHYGEVTHDVLDKYERGRHVMNEDICNYSAAAKYALIVSISTFEHIGYDDDGHSRPQEALAHCEQLLKPNGQIVITAPLGYNPSFDELIASGWPEHGQVSFMKRTSKTVWQQCRREDVEEVRYGSPFPYGNGLVVITVSRRCNLA